MKKFSFRIARAIDVYAESEEEAKTIFCDDPGAWDFDGEDMVLVAVQDFGPPEPTLAEQVVSDPS